MDCQRLQRVHSSKDSTGTFLHKLRELGDLLMEVLSAKAERDFLGLTFLDTSHGVNPVAQK